jgi:PAS domain S-box-containing protein
MRPANKQVRKIPAKPAARTSERLKDSGTRMRAEDERLGLAHDLQERVKELDCLYEVARIIETPDISLVEMLQKTVNILPAAFQYPEIACARIVLDDKVFRTSNYSATKWLLSAELKQRGERIGQVEVHYLEERPAMSEGPFLEEKRPLIDAIAERLSRVVERKRAETALKDKVEDLRRLATVVSDSNDAVIMHDLDGKILAWNLGAKEMYGYIEAEALGKNVREIVAESDRGAALTLIEKIKQGDIVKSFELRRLTKDGRVLDVWLTTTLLRDEKGQPVAIATTERDITERKRAEKALNDKVEDLRRLATVVSDSNDAVIMHDLDGKILAWNRGAKEMYGYTEAEALGKNVREIVAEADREAALTLIEKIKQGDIVKSFELRCLTKDGRILNVWLTTTLLMDESGKPVAVATTERDITERKRAETVLQQKLEELGRMATVVSDSNDAVIMHDFDGKILAWNRGAKETYGYTEAEALGKNVREIVAEPDREAALTLIQNIKQGKLVKSFELRRLAKDGRVLDVWLTSTLLRDEKGQPVAIATTERDITERNRTQEEIRELNAGLERRVIERTTQLEAANKELEAFSYSVSHDLRAPLRSIDGFSQILLEDYADKIDAEGQDALKRVRAAAQRMAQLIDDMLKLSRVTRSEMRLETVGLSSLAHAVLDELQRTQPGRQVDCVIAEGIVAKGDTQLLRAVLENLLGNAWKFTGKQGYARIEFGRSQRDGETAYFVCDNGAGFDMAFVNKLFGAFQRLHTVEEFPGTGIGLATVQRIIHRHGGRVWAEGALAQGATFYFTLPEEVT